MFLTYEYIILFTYTFDKLIDCYHGVIITLWLLSLCDHYCVVVIIV